MNAVTQNLRSLGKLCADLQQPYHRLAKIIDANGIAAVMVLNGVRHFDEAAVEKIHAALAAGKCGSFKARSRTSTH